MISPRPILKRTWVLLLLISFGMGRCCFLLQAGEYGVKVWGVDEGLAQSSVTSIAQTPDGFLWIGTFLSGVSRFDGVKFVNYDSANTPALTSPGVRRLLVDTEGNLWLNDQANQLFLRQNNTFIKVGENMKIYNLVSSRKGRITFATQTGELIMGLRKKAGGWLWERHQPANVNYTVKYMEDADGLIWFQLADGSIGRFIKGHFDRMNSPPGIDHQKILFLGNDASGRIWVGTDMQLACWQNGIFTNMNPGGATTTFGVDEIVSAEAGSGLWVESAGRLYLYNNGHWSKPVSGWNARQTPWSHSRSYRADHLGGLWISLDDGGLVHISKDGQMAHITSQDGLPGETLQVFFADQEGNFWGGYHYGGLVLLRKRTFQTFKRTQEHKDLIVTSLAEDCFNAIWMGMSSGSLLRWQDGELTNYSLVASGFNCRDVVTAAAPDGRIWLGTTGAGLLVFDKRGFHRINISAGTTREIRRMLVTRNGDLLFASAAGLNFWDGQNLSRIFNSPTAESHVLSIAQDSRGWIWFGTADGVLRCWRDGQITAYRPQDGVPPARFWALFPDADDTIWIGTMGQGLLRFKNGDFTRFTTANGLASDSISQIIADGRGNLWLGSQAGIMRVPAYTLVRSKPAPPSVPCRLFGRSDGLPTSVMTLEFQPTCLKSHNGDLWFASPQGATWVNPKDIRPAQPPPPILIERVLADNRVCAFLSKKSTDQIQAIELDPDVKTLEVIFTSPTFADPELTRFKYRLNPKDEWTDLDSKRNVIFNSLAAGTYEFQVTAVNCDGLTSVQPAEFRLIVPPHFWQRGSIRFATVLGLVLLAAYITRRITHQKMRRRLEIARQKQQIEQERARIAQDLHDDLGAGLTEISMASDLIENPDLATHESRQYTREIGLRARQLVQRMDEIVWAVNPRNDSAASLSSYACEYAQTFLLPLNLDCVVEVAPDLPNLTLNADQRYNFFLAFKEVVNNVARHAEATHLKLSIQIENGWLTFLIEDNGKGFELNRNRSGSDGLRNIRDRLTRLRGECEISTQPGIGTRVRLRLPLTECKQR